MTKPLIVVIDDSTTIRRSSEIFLQQAGFEVRAYESGFDGIAALATVKPVMIFLDVMMDGIDGYATCKLIKAHHHSRRIPVVILTAKGGLAGETHAKLSGADDLLTKPFTKQSLVDMVNKHIAKNGITAAA